MILVHFPDSSVVAGFGPPGKFRACESMALFGQSSWMGPEESGESEQSAGADHPECFIQQFPIHRVDLQHPLPGVTHNQTGHVMQAGSEGAGPIAVPLETEGHAQQNRQVAGNHIQVQTDRIGPECAAGQVSATEIAAQFLETIFRAVCTLVVPPHDLRIAEPVPIQIRRDGTVCPLPTNIVTAKGEGFR